MERWQKLAGGAFAFAVLAGAAGPATALPVIDTWDYTLDNAFTEWDADSVIGLDPNPTLGGATRLEWPVSFDTADRSALEVEQDTLGVVNGTVDTNGGPAPGATLTHFNFPIPTDLEPEFLTSGRLSVQATLTPNTPPEGGSAGPFTTFFDFLFDESPNVEDCGFPSTSNCDDLFVLAASGDLVQEFSFLDEIYTLTFGSEVLAPLDGDTCALVGLGAGCIGFLTTEEGVTDFVTFITVTHEAGPPPSVPEPGMLILFGTGLVALGVVRRRKAA